MGFQVSPGVDVNEINATNVIPAVSTSIGGFVGSFSWGPCDEIITVGSENGLANIFGTPTPTNAKHFLTAAGFLKYGNNLKTVRVVDTAARNASGSTAQTLVKNKDVHDLILQAAFADHGLFIARCPGVLGNAITVEMCYAKAGGSGFSGWTTYKDLFDTAPGTSDYAKNVKVGQGLTAANAALFFDEVHVAVIDASGAITGTPGTVLETYPFLSVCSDAKDVSGSSIFYKDVINTKSQYVFTALDDANGTDGDATHLNSGSSVSASAATVVNTAISEATGADLRPQTVMTGGVDAVAALSSEMVAGWALFADSESVDVSLLFAFPEDATSNATMMNTAIARKDCMAMLAPPIASGDTATNAVTYATSLTSTSYAALCSTNGQVYDKYNDQFVWIGLGGHMAGLCAGTDDVADPWFSPAGFTRGQIFGVTKLAYAPNQANRDDLYKARVNPIVAFPGEGTVLYGDKTLEAKPNAFDRINVRRLFIVLEKAIATAAKYQLFEFNDEFTRAMFRNMTEPFLRDVKGRRGVTDFLVKCDEENNTGNIIDTNQFVADIYIKPARSINFIKLNFIATRTGVDFSEIAG